MYWRVSQKTHCAPSKKSSGAPQIYWSQGVYDGILKKIAPKLLENIKFNNNFDGKFSTISI